MYHYRRTNTTQVNEKKGKTHDGQKFIDSVCYNRHQVAMSNRKSKKVVSALILLFSGSFECAENDYQEIIFRIDGNNLEIGDINRKIGYFFLRFDIPSTRGQIPRSVISIAVFEQLIFAVHFCKLKLKYSNIILTLLILINLRE